MAALQEARGARRRQACLEDDKTRWLFLDIARGAAYLSAALALD
ncbi:MAG: hypothetical protein ABTQ31_15815 [Rhizobiaceae bacterium]